MKPRPIGTLIALALGYAVGGCALTLALTGAMELNAQGIASHDTRAPVSVDAGRIDVQERENRVAFSGDVVVTQAGLTVRAQRMMLSYVEADSLELQRITATGNVSVTRGNQRATGSTAVYDFNRRVITLAGDVQVNQGDNILGGGRLVIDLDTGLLSFDGQSASTGSTGAQTPLNSRVSGTFTVPQGDEKDEE
ncbi:MAG: LptA/OstA family protein [Pseudomonadota bacterium]